MMKPKIFVSHSSLDTAFASKLVSDLNAAGAQAWLDSNDLGAGNFQKRIDDALGNCEWFVLVLTSNALASEWVRQEVYAANRLKNHGRIRELIFIMAAKVEPHLLPATWGVYNIFDASINGEEASKYILKAVGLPSDSIDPAHTSHGESPVRKTTLLLAEDQKFIRQTTARWLAFNGFEVIEASDGVEAVDKARAQSPDLILLDIDMPNLNGIQACRGIRTWSSVPIIMLTANDDGVATVAALDSGADDYITKYVSVDELLARIRAVLRRRQPLLSPQSSVTTVGQLVVDHSTGRVTIGGNEIELTTVEFTILDYLAQNAGREVEASALMKEVWGAEGSNMNLLEVYIGYLRSKLANDPAHSLRILRLGKGYTLTEQIG